MIDVFNDICSLLDSVFYPLFILISSITLPVVEAGSFDGVLYIFGFLAIFYDPTIFPVWFSISMTFYILSLFVKWVGSLIRYLVDLIPVW